MYSSCVLYAAHTQIQLEAHRTRDVELLQLVLHSSRREQPQSLDSSYHVTSLEPRAAPPPPSDGCGTGREEGEERGSY